MSTERIEVPADKETIAAWQASLQEPPRGGDEGHTCAEIAKMIGLSLSQTRVKLKRGVEAGKYIRGKAYRTDSGGHAQFVPVYRQVKKPAKGKK
jgi:hypothetical protein